MTTAFTAIQRRVKSSAMLAADPVFKRYEVSFMSSATLVANKGNPDQVK
jgi:hypothetical protein